MMKTPRRLLLTAALGAAFAAQARPPPVVAFDDPRGDDHGPGSYVYPTGSEYRRGDFDLRRFEVRVEGNEAVIDVTLGAKVRRDVTFKRGNASDLDLNNGIYVQNIDIYVDTTDGVGFTEGLPGRRIAFPPESAWDVAIAITPRPDSTRTVLKGWNKAAANKVITPGPVQASGSTLTVRVPLAQLGGVPQKTWGWSVMVGGASWEQGFEVLSRITRTHQHDAFTMPVYAVPEERAFGGGKLNSGIPYVADVILPEGSTQAQVLGTFTQTSPAIVPMIYPDPSRLRAKAQPPQAESDVPRAISPAAPRAEAPNPAEKTPDAGVQMLKIASIDGDTVVIPTPEGGVKVWQIGTVVDENGRQQGRVVVTMLSEGFVMAKITDGRNAVRVGHQVRFAGVRE